MKHLSTIFGLLLLITIPAFAATRTWSGTVDNHWNNPANWDGTTPVSGDDLVFPVGGLNALNLSNDLPATNDYHSLTFSTDSYSIFGNGFHLGAGGVTQGAGANVSISGKVTLTASQTWTTAGPQYLVLSGAAGGVDLGANDLSVVRNGTLWFLGAPLNGTGNLTFGGTATGRFGLNTSNLTGLTTVGVGAHFLAESPDFKGPLLLQSGSFLDVPSSDVGFLGAVTLAAGSTFTVNINGPSTLSRIVANNTAVVAGNLVVAETGTVPAGTTFQILVKQGPGTISGTFNGLAEGDVVHAGPQDFVISYIGGSGDDVSLTALAVGSTASTTTLAQSSSSSAQGANVDFTATVVPSGATGSIDFFDGAALLGSAPVSGGQAILTNSSLSAGSHTITATYNGDSTYATSTSNSVGHFVLTDTITLLNTTPNPSNFGQNVNLNATVNDSAATGSIEFFDEATSLGTQTVSAGTAAINVSTLSAGSHSLSAVYSGDATFSTSTSDVVVQVVNGAATPTATALASSLNPSVLGEGVTFTATVTPSGATGNVAFLDGVTQIGMSTLDGSGQATFTTSSLTAGTHSITASYGGDGTHAVSTSAVLSQTVKQPTSTTVTSSFNPSTVGDPVTFTAVVTPAGGTLLVNFFDGATTIGTGELSPSGQATFTTSTLAVGAHSISASYQGDENYEDSPISPAIVQQVNSASGITTTTTLMSTPNPSDPGQNVTFTANVTPAGATGTVNFFDGITQIGSGTLDGSGQTTLTTSFSVSGPHSITASYAGDTTNAASTSTVLSQMVALTTVATTTTLTSMPNPSTFGQTVTLTATVSPLGATGTVDFYDGNALLGSSSLNAQGQATFTTTSLTVGIHPLRAIYDGDANHSPSTSIDVTQTVTSVAVVPSASVPMLDVRALALLAILLAILGATALQR